MIAAVSTHYSWSGEVASAIIGEVSLQEGGVNSLATPNELRGGNYGILDTVFGRGGK